MKHLAVYHNPDKMGPLTPGIVKPMIYTNKRLSDARGDRVWLLAGEGKPRTFFLCLTFVVDDQVDRPRAEFNTELWGEEGDMFTPFVVVGDFPWFENFRASQANFRRGPSEMAQQFVDHLLQILSHEPTKKVYRRG